MTETLYIKLETAGKPKARPRVTSRGTHMPPDYTEWIESAALELALRAGTQQFGEQQVSIGTVFASDHVRIRIEPMDLPRPKYVRGDIDNLAGGILDALVKAAIIDDDRQVHELFASMHRV
jgi:Holliday junction resolvase RusA-like endonuclease